MTEDARFEDAGEAPLRLIARDPEDLQVVSTLIQDAVLPAAEMRWDAAGRRFAVLLNRFRWEDRAAADAASRSFERVQTVLMIHDAAGVASTGFNRRAADLVLSVLSITFEPGDPPGGWVVLTLAGDGAIRCEVEDLEVTLRDVTRPYRAPSGQAPRHPD